MYDVTVIGAGVVGGLIARELSTYDISVCIIEKSNDVATGSTKANSAIVHAGFDASPGTLKAILGVRGAKMMKALTDELGVKYIKNGSLVVGFDEEDRKKIYELYERGIKNGVDDLKIIDNCEVKSLEPNISDNVICALYAPSGAITCPYELTVAAIGNAMDNGVELIRNFEVKSIRSEDGTFVISSGVDEVKSKRVINAAGLFADEIAGMVGDTSFSIIPRRGEYQILDTECGGLVKTTIFKTPSNLGKGILVSPTVDGNIILGPTAEDIDDKDDISVTSGGIDSIIKQTRERIKNIPCGKVITSFCGLRAVNGGGDFIIEESKSKKCFINVAGIESPGLSASPAIAEYVVNILKSTGLILKEKNNFSSYRAPFDAFKHMSLEEKNAVIKKNPSYGKIVCRCEGITEGEIIDAIRRNPRPLDLDGVKRRTRSGMGRCQGGFCSPSVISLISRELSLAYEDVTKFGGASKLILKKIR